MKHYTKNIRNSQGEAAKNYAKNYPLEVLEHVAGIPAELLDGRHHPCPACGGRDRFRLIDSITGTVYCNQCFYKKNGDALTAVMHFRGVSFVEALRLVGEYAGSFSAQVPTKPTAKPHKAPKTASTGYFCFEEQTDPETPLVIVRHWEYDGRTFQSRFIWNGYYYEATRNPGTQSKMAREIVYDWSDELGNPRHLVHRMEYKLQPGETKRKKITIPYHWDEEKQCFLRGEGGIPRVPFNACELKEAAMVFIVEGEKAACAFQEYLQDRENLHPKFAALVHGLDIPDVVVTTTGGATSWRAELVPWFVGKHVKTIPDNDEAGRKYANGICLDLLAAGVDAVILDLFKDGDFKPGYDVADLITVWKGRTHE